MYRTTPLRPRSHPAHTSLTPRSHLAQVPFSRESRRPLRAVAVANIHPTINKLRLTIDHGIRARRRLAPQRRSSLRIAGRSLEEYITADPQRELEVRR
jgi:hypothetical protein